MSQDGAYGDQLTLYAAANLYNIDVQIVSSLGAGGQHVFSPSASIATATVYLGHFAENQGEHFVALEPVMSDHDNGEEVLEDITEEYASRTEGNIDMGDTVNDDDCDEEIEQQEGADDLGDVVVEVEESDQPNETALQIIEGGEEQIALQFVPDEDVGSLASASNRDCCIENLPNELLEKIFQMVLISSAALFAGNACHSYQSLCGVSTRFRAVTQRLTRMLPRVYISGGVQSFVISVRSLIKKYGTSSGLIMELKSIISDPKWANAWLEIRKDGYDWCVIKRIFWKKK